MNVFKIELYDCRCNIIGHKGEILEFILPRSHNQLIHNNKRFSFIDKLLLYKFVHFMTYIVPFYTTFLREYLRKPPVVDL